MSKKKRKRIPTNHQGKKPTRNNGLAQHKRNILTIIMLLCVLFATWLFVAPKMEKKRLKALQQELLASVEQSSSEVSEESDVSEDISSVEPTVAEIPLVTENEITAEPEPPKPQPFTISGDILGIGILSIDKINLKLPVTDDVSEERLKQRLS